jgi:hypothetical protein
MTFTLVVSSPDPVLSFSAGTIMAQIDKWHWDNRDGSVSVDANGEGHGPYITQGTDLILELQTLGSISNALNDLSNVGFSAQFREYKSSNVVQATAQVTLIDANTARVRVTAAETAGIQGRKGVWDLEATWTDADGSIGLRTRRILEGRYKMNTEVTR